jgi:hypothetical protein
MSTQRRRRRRDTRRAPDCLLVGRSAIAASFHLGHFPLDSAPLPLMPDSDVVFAGGTRKASVDAVLHLLRAERGIAKVLGDPGTGKTMLCRHLSRTLADRYTVVCTCDPSPVDEQTRYALADALRLEIERGRIPAAAAAVRRRIGELHGAGRPVVLRVDEAQVLRVDTPRLRGSAQPAAGALTDNVGLPSPRFVQDLRRAGESAWVCPPRCASGRPKPKDVRASATIVGCPQRRADLPACAPDGRPSPAPHSRPSRRWMPNA